MLRHSLLLGAGLVVVATAAHAQTRKREDLLDALTTHIQICAEISDGQSRLACYDKLQTRVGDVQPQTPTPLRPSAPPPPQQQMGSSTGGSMGGTPLSPPPLTVPGGGNATLGGSGVQGGMLAPPNSDPDQAFDTRAATSGYRPPEGAMPKPQPIVRRTGPRPIPNFATPQSLVTLAANNLTYNDARYWQVSIAITSNTPRTLTTQIQCTFLNAGRPVGDAYFGPADIAAGEQITTDMIGPPTTAFVDSTSCRVMSP
jgi:hypothetical protein